MEQCETKAISKKREYLFDNYKALLIVLVVISHLIEQNYKNNMYLYELKWAIVSFHMPAFIFISGYFSKKRYTMKKLVSGLVIPYFVYEVLYYLLYTLLLHKETKLYLDRPKFSLWYLIALFAWRLVAPIVSKIPGHIYISIIAGLLIGLCGLGNFLSIPRIVFFFPFFLAGRSFDSTRLKKYQNKKYRCLAVGIIVIGIIFLFLDSGHRALSTYIFYGRYSYAEMNMDCVSGICVRAACYAISFLLLFLVMLVIPTQEKRYSYYGQRTMPIYIFHGFVYSVLKFGTNILPSVHTNLQSVFLIIFCLFLVWLFARKPFVIITEKISHLI
ncbi:MAG: acyltransferase family protein [Eubacteriales bacterium]|nr:acyltransferase family protein [Eubacteriales bacterium]